MTLAPLAILRRMDAGDDLISYGYGETYLGALSMNAVLLPSAVRVDEDVVVSMDCRQWIEWLPYGTHGVARITWAGFERLDQDGRRREQARRRREALRPYQRQLRGWRQRRRKGPVTYR